MNSVRDIMRRARSHLHDRMRVGANYYATPTSQPLAITVRHHGKFDAIGALPGTGSEQHVDRVEATPRVVIRSCNVTQPRVNAIVCIEDGEAYRLAVIAPADECGEFFCDVVRLPADQAANYEAPA